MSIAPSMTTMKPRLDPIHSPMYMSVLLRPRTGSSRPPGATTPVRPATDFRSRAPLPSDAHDHAQHQDDGRAQARPAQHLVEARGARHGGPAVDAEEQHRYQAESGRDEGQHGPIGQPGQA